MPATCSNAFVRAPVAGMARSYTEEHNSLL